MPMYDRAWKQICPPRAVIDDDDISFRYLVADVGSNGDASASERNGRDALKRGFAPKKSHTPHVSPR